MSRQHTWSGTISALVIIAASIPALSVAAMAAPPGDSPSDAPRHASPPKGLGRLVTTARETTRTKDPDGSTVFRVDDGFDLDQYLGRDSSPLDWSMDIDENYGPVDSEGHPGQGHLLHDKSLLLTLRSYDVDHNSGEIDHLYVNGTRVGDELTGANDQWSTNTFEVPSNLLVFPSTDDASRTNDFSIDIDVNNDGWAVEVDWVELRPRISPSLPIAFVHGITGTGADMTASETYFTSRSAKLSGRTIKPNTTKISSVATNEGLLSRDIDALLADEPLKRVDLVAHSKGGLESRLYAYFNPDKARNVVMIGTPNGGSELANLICNSEGDKWWQNPIGAGIDANFKQFGECKTPDSGIHDLQTGWVRNYFNVIVPDQDQSFYYTVGGDKGLSGGESTTSSILPGQDDGAVTVDSLTWLDRNNPPDGSDGGRHVNLKKNIYQNHSELIGASSEALPYAYRAIVGETGGVISGPDTPGGPVIAKAPSASRAERLEANLASGDLVTGAGVTGVVPKKGTARAELSVAEGESATLVLVTGAGVTATIPGATTRDTELLGTPARELTFTGPARLTLTNGSNRDAGYAGYLAVESSRALSLDATAAMMPAGGGTLRATLTDALPTDAIGYSITDQSGEIVADGNFTSVGGDEWQAPITLNAVGEYQAAAWVDGTSRRTASTPLAVYGGASISAGISENPVDEDGDGRVDRLDVTVPVSVDANGTYSLSAVVKTELGTSIAQGFSTPSQLDAGPGSMTVSFRGKDLGNSDQAGPWRLGEVVLAQDDLSVKARAGDLADLTYDDPSYYEIDALAVTGLADSLADTDDDGTPDGIDLAVDTQIRLTGNYAFNGRLVAADGTEVARAQGNDHLERGPATVHLVFQKEALDAAGLDGPYTLRDFSMYPSDSSGDGVSLVDAHRTRAYAAGDLSLLAPRPDGPVVLSGIARVGRTLTATSPTWSPASTLNFQWLRNGDPITGATKESLAIADTDLGASIAVRVTAKADGYAEGSATSDPRTIAARTIDGGGLPLLRGRPTVGQKLTAIPPTWTADGASVRYRYQWLRNGRSVAGATGATYHLALADVAATIAVRVSGSAPTAPDRVGTSAALRVGRAKPIVTARAKGAKRAATIRVAVSVPGLARADIDGRLVVTSGGRRVGKAKVINGKANVKVKRQRPGKRAYRVTFVTSRHFQAATGRASATVR